MAELKHCPFCGGKARLLITQTATNDNPIFREWKYEYIVKCNKCRASVGRYQKIETAKKAWDRRAEE